MWSDVVLKNIMETAQGAIGEESPTDWEFTVATLERLMVELRDAYMDEDVELNEQQDDDDVDDFTAQLEITEDDIPF